MAQARMLAALTALALVSCSHAGGGLGGATSLTITPSSATVDLAADSLGVYAASARFTATARFSDGSSRDVSDQVAWSIATPAAVEQGAARAAVAGVFAVTATAGDTTAGATFTARLHGSYGGANIDTARLDAAIAAPAGLSIAYPLDGTVFPSNLAPITVQVRKSHGSQAIARLELKADPAVDARYYAACEPGPNSAEGCYVSLPAALTSVLTFVSGTTDIQLVTRLAAADGSALDESAAIELAWADTPLSGGLYYWTTLAPSQNNGTTGIARYDFKGDASKPEIVYTDKGSPQSHDGSSSCVGCHALTHDGSKMALTIGGSYPSDWMLLDVASLSQIALKNQGPAGYATATTFSPDGSRMVNMYRGDLTLRGTEASLVDQGPVLVSSAGEKKADPFWSVDGKWFAFVGWVPGQFGAPPASDSLALDGDVKTGGQIWIAPSDGQSISDQATPLVPRVAGVTSYYPCLSDDSDLVVFNQSSCSGPSTNRGYGDGPCDGYSDPSARLLLVKPTGGTPIALERASGPPNSMSSWPRFSPDHGIFRGGRLYWIAFSSERAYGLQVNRGAPLRPQLWFAAVTLAQGEAFTSTDPSHPPAWLPGQNPDPAAPSGNHVPQWVSRAVPLR